LTNEELCELSRMLFHLNKAYIRELIRTANLRENSRFQDLEAKVDSTILRLEDSEAYIDAAAQQAAQIAAIQLRSNHEKPRG